MKRNADTVLWTERKFRNANGKASSIPIFVSFDCWTYFINKLKRHPSFDGVDFTPTQSNRTLRTFFQDLSSQAVPYPTNIYSIEANTSEQFQCLRELFGTGYGFGVRRPRDTKNSGLKALQVFETINVLDYLSSGKDDGIDAVEPDALDAPEISNKIIFLYNSVTSFVTIRYYYRFIRVRSSRGQELLQSINHRLMIFDNNESSPIVEGSTFLFDGDIYRTLPHFTHMSMVNTENVVNGTLRDFEVDEVRELINNHNAHNIDDDDDL